MKPSGTCKSCGRVRQTFTVECDWRYPWSSESQPGGDHCTICLRDPARFIFLGDPGREVRSMVCDHLERLPQEAMADRIAATKATSR